MSSMNRKMVLLVLGILLCFLMVVPACNDGTDDVLVGALGDDPPDDGMNDDEGDEDEDGESDEDEDGEEEEDVEID